jgi:hypothetical protein
MAHIVGGKSRIEWPPGSSVDALFGGPDDCYRYALMHIWNPFLPLILWVMMNPSTADLQFSDNTLFKTYKFSRKWGFGGQLIGNIYAYRATDQNRLLECADPIGPDNDLWLT